MLTALGLILDLIGAVLVGFIVPRYQGVAYGGPIVTNSTGKLFSGLGWSLLGLGFALQLAGSLVQD